jgi:hypothetical protein
LTSRKKSRRGRDWYKVSVETLQGLAVLVLLVITAGVTFVVFQRWQLHGMEQEAARLIDEASVLVQQLRGDPAVDDFRNEYQAGRRSLEEARTSYAAKQWEPALEAARRSREVLLSIIDAARDQGEEGEAQVIAVSGAVEMRRGSRGEWDEARARVTLRTGDYVKTGPAGSAEIMFADGTLYTVRPDTLLLISPSRGEGRTAERAVQLEYGWVNLNTGQQGSKVATPRAEARVHDESEAQVTYDQQTAEARFAAFRGEVEVATESGASRRLEALQQVTQKKDLLGETNRLPATPVPRAPADNVEVDIEDTHELVLSWQEVKGARGYNLQVARNRLFADNIIDVHDRRKASATLGVRGEGSFVWRVAAVAADGTAGPWTAPQRFRVATFRGRPGEGDEIPPKLEVQDIQAYGSIFIVSGVTEPGASVTVNGEAVTVEADGSFKKTIQIWQQGWEFLVVTARDVAGNETRRRHRVFIENL